MAPSENGKGRTIFEMLSGRNKRDMTPQEFKYPNPLGARIGTSMSFTMDHDMLGLNFFVQSILVGTTNIASQSFIHTDYQLRAIAPGQPPIRVKLRVEPDEDAPNDLKHRLYFLRNYTELRWDAAQANNFLSVLADPEGVFKILTDADGTVYDEADQPTYWRIDDVRDPYPCRVTILKDLDGDGAVQKDELQYLDYLIWDYHRDTVLEDQPVREYLYVEEETDSRYFVLYRGREVSPFQVTVL